jgi:hypothetical protein
MSPRLIRRWKVGLSARPKEALVTDVAALEAREREVRDLADVLAKYDGDDLLTLFLGNFRRVLGERDAAREEVERQKGLRMEAAKQPWSFHRGPLRERLEWCRVQHLNAAENPPLYPPTREQKVDFDRACVAWYAEMVEQCDELLRLAGSYTCGSCGAVVAFEGELPTTCLRCDAALAPSNPGRLSDAEVLAEFWLLKAEVKERGLSTTTHPWPPPQGATS